MSRTPLSILPLEDRTVPSVTIVDDGDPGYIAGTGWLRETGPVYAEYYGSDVGHITSSSPSVGDATWTATNLTAGQYRVSATWTAHPNRATNAAYCIEIGGVTVATRTVNQEVNPDDLITGGTRWEHIGVVNLTAAGSITARLNGQSNDVLIADAVRFERIGGVSPPSPVTIVDDGDAGFSAPLWQRETGPVYAEYYGSDTAHTASAAPATWTADLEPGLYRVSATWTAWGNRSPWVVYSVGGVTTGHNQLRTPWSFVENGTRWGDIGFVTHTGGSLTVTATAGLPGVVIGDAVRFERVTSTNTSRPGYQIQLSIAGATRQQEAVIQAAADRWTQVIVGDVPDVTVNGLGVIDDLLVEIDVGNIDGPGGILGRAGSAGFRPVSLMPSRGFIGLDRADASRLEQDGRLYSVVLHELAHVIGFGTIWFARGFVSGSGTANPLFTGPQATAEYNARFNTNAAGVPLETGGGPGTAEGHWRQSVFGNELMVGWLGFGPRPLSRITVASFADLGYVVDFNAADPF